MTPRDPYPINGRNVEAILNTFLEKFIPDSGITIDMEGEPVGFSLWFRKGGNCIGRFFSPDLETVPTMFAWNCKKTLDNLRKCHIICVTVLEVGRG